MISSPPTLLLSPEQRSAVLDLVHRQFGIRVSDYGASRVDDAVHSVLPKTACATPDELLVILEHEGSEKSRRWLHDLVEHLTVGETYFLRDPAQIAALRETILPDVISRRSAERRLRLWSAGCSTGEEPYTLAILLYELGVTPEWDVQLVGSDVNGASLRVAREGRYSAWSFRATPTDIRERYFEPTQDRWRLIDSIRGMVRFAWMNLAADALLPPSTDLDLIVCRNVTIYFDDAATQRLYRGLVRALAPGGWLMLGPSDPLPSDREGLERFEVRDAVLWRRSSSVKTLKAAKLEPPKRPARPRVLAAQQAPVPVDGRADLEAGLLALEARSFSEALEWLRRATFREPASPLAQFALARAYAENGDLRTAHIALLQAQRLLTPLDGECLVPGSDALPVETLRQTIRIHLERRHV
jgi:chemotaxis protein methyltransferase CheR